MSLIIFDFVTKKRKKKAPHKEFTKVLKNIKSIVSPYMRLEAQPQDCSVIEMFREKNLFVDYPPCALGEISIVCYNNPQEGSYKGTMNIGGNRRDFSIKDNVLYICK